MAFTFGLYLESGEDVGTPATAAPDWRIGDEFRDGYARYRITNIVVDEDLHGDEFHGLFVVNAARARKLSERARANKEKPPQGWGGFSGDSGVKAKALDQKARPLAPSYRLRPQPRIFCVRFRTPGVLSLRSYAQWLRSGIPRSAHCGPHRKLHTVSRVRAVEHVPNDHL
jgi:hypothetical protein